MLPDDKFITHLGLLYMSKTITLTLLKITSKLEISSECVITYESTVSYEETSPCSLKFESSEFGHKRFNDIDIFGCLCELRKFLEKEDWNILCNGARVDAYPSTMSRQMGGGQKLYLLKVGEQPKRNDLVNIFDRAAPDKIGTVDEQRGYYNKWVESVIQRQAL